MKLHLPKALAAAVMVLFAIPNALADTVTVTVDGTQYAGTTVLTSGDAPTDKTTNFLFSTGSEYTIQNTSTSTSHWVSSVPKGKTLIAASATYETLDESGETATITSSATPLFFDTGNKGNIEVLANIVIGRSAASAANDLRFWSGNSYCSILKGDLTLVGTTARIYNQEGTQYLEGSIKGLGKTLNITGKNEAARLRLSGGGTIGTLNLAESGSSVTLSATKHDGTTAASSKEYTITTLNSANSTAALTVESGVTLNLTNLTAGKLINEGTLNLGGTGISSTLAVQGLSNVGILNILNDTAVNLDLTEYAGTHIGSAVTTTVESEGGTVTKPANGFGKISSFELSSLIAGTVNVESGVSWTEGQNALTYSDGVLSYGTGQGLTSTIYQINDAESGYDLTGATSVVIGATNGTVSLTGATSLDITVKKGAVLNINGKMCGNCDLVLAGGTLTNSGEKIEAAQQQLNSLTLTANSMIDAVLTEDNINRYFGVVASLWNSTFIDLGGNTLTKAGNGQFYAASTNLRGGGTLKITGGDFNLGVDAVDPRCQQGSIGHVDDSADTNIWFTGGTLSSGKGIYLNKNVEFLAQAETGVTSGVTGVISAALDLKNKTATFKAAAANDKLVISGLISDSTNNATNPKVSVTGSGTVEFAAGSGGGKVMVLTLSADSTLLCNAGADRVLKFDCLNFHGALSIDSGEVQSINTRGAESDHVTISSLSIKEGATMNLTATYKEHVFVSGTLTGGGILKTSCASRTDQADGYRATVISGDASGFTGEWLLETASGTDNSATSNRRVNGMLNTATFGGVVKFTGSNGDATKAGSQLLLAQDSSIAGLQSDAGLTNAVVKGVNYTSSTTDAILRGNFDSVKRTLTIAGNKNLSFSGKLDSLVSLVVGDGTNAASQTFDGATVGGSMELKDYATVTATGNTSIAALKGTGTLTTSGASVTNGSAFTGTLESTGETLAVTQVGATLAAVKAEGGDINLLNTSSVTVTDMVIGAGQMVGVYNGETGAVGDVSVTTLKVTSSEGSAAKLYANLNLSKGGTLTLNGTLTMGNMLTQVSTLTLGSGITLSGSLLDSWMDKSNALTLFSGVDGLTVNGASVAAGETNGVKASDVFGDSWSNYSLFMTGGTNNKDYNVQLVQTSDTPEPTTATLSLLALMGLAARRRRKAAK
ncbi:MAG: hypothetical protein MSQ05_07335 [Akkermansia sp.]|nr:hypothetical protein [Akkermansia sp.]